MGNIGSDPGSWGKRRIQGPFSKIQYDMDIEYNVEYRC